MTAAAASPARSMVVRRVRIPLGRFLLRWVVLIAGVAGWELATRQAGSAFFPPPSQIVERMVDLWFSGPASRLWLTDAALNNVLPSLGRMLLGLAASAVLGVLIGLALGRSQRVYAYVDPLLQFFRAIPPPTLTAVFIVIFKIGVQMEVATIVFGAVWPILLNTTEGARSVDALHIQTARVFRLSRLATLWHVIIPSTLPKVFAGLRLSLSLALILMVFAELVGSSSGIGYQLVNAQSTFDLPAMWSAIVLLGILGYVLNVVLVMVERVVLRWHRGARRNDE